MGFVINNKGRHFFYSYFKLLRIESWIPIFFNFALGSIMFSLPSLLRFSLFSLSLISALSGIFVINQFFDYEIDSINEYKKNLPISAGNISPRNSILISLVFISLSIGLILFVDAYSSILFIVSIGLGIIYSAPPFRLKDKPIIDVICSGLGAGVLPFLIGLQVSNQLTADIHLSWMRRRYQDALFCVLPSFLFFSAIHILQAFGDYESDRKTDVHSFVVKFGKNTSFKVVKIFFFICGILPILYGVLNLSYDNFLIWYLFLLMGIIPVLGYIVFRLKPRSNENFNLLRKFFLKVGPITSLLVWIYVLILRTILL